jgi:excisionase family DNA binding protein
VNETVERLLTVQDVADAFQTPPAYIRGLARSGDLPGLRIGRRWRFRESSVEAWSRAREAHLSVEREAL